LTGFTEGTDTAELSYDAAGLLLSDTRRGVRREFVWNYAFDLPSVSVLRQGGLDLRYYVHTPRGELLYSLEAGDGSRGFYHYDEMGNTLFLSNDAGSMTDRYAYSPYGTLLASTGLTDNPFTFQGRHGVLRLSSTGLYSVRTRVYDSTTAAFLSRDPVVRLHPKLINPYQFAARNPLTFVDMTGQDPEPPQPAGGGIVQGADTAAVTGEIVGPWLEGLAPSQELQEIANKVSPRSRQSAQEAYRILIKGPERFGTISAVGKWIRRGSTALQLVQRIFDVKRIIGAQLKVGDEYDEELRRNRYNYEARYQQIMDDFKAKKISYAEAKRLHDRISQERQLANDAAWDIFASKLWLNFFIFEKDLLGSRVPGYEFVKDKVGLAPEEKLQQVPGQ
jgi:RHS repeat-associated protein